METEPLGPPSALGLGHPPGSERGAGRPPLDAAKRALNDERYAQTMELLDQLPPEAKELRFKVYEAYNRRDAKRSFDPACTILMSEWRDSNLSDKPTLAAYLAEKIGEGRYCVEAYDAQNVRVTRAPPWYLTAGDDMSDDDYDDAPRDRFRPRRSRRRDPDFVEDDEEGEPDRASVADLITTASKASGMQLAQVSKSGSDMVSMMLMMQQQQVAARADDDRRREDRAAEERKRQEEREERRREDMEERRARDEVQRKEDAKYREEAEERRRRDDAERMKHDNERHLQEMRALSEKDTKRMEIMVTLATAALPVITKLFEKKDDPVLAMLLANAGKKEEPDPMQMMFFKSILDKMNNDQGPQNLVAQMGELMKLSSTMSTEQMRSMMANSNEFNQVLMKKALDLATASGGEGGGEKTSMMENIVKALAGAGDIVKAFVPPQAQPVPQHAMPQQRRVANLPQAPSQQAQAPQQQQAAQAQQPTPDMRTADQVAYDQMTDEEKARLAERTPQGIEAVVWSLYTLQTKQYVGPAEYQSVMEHLVANIPLDLRVAVLDNNEAKVMELVLPHIQNNETLNAWVGHIAVLGWLRAFVPQLIGPIQAMHGPADDQRNQLMDALTAPPEARTPGPETDAPVPTVIVTEAVIDAQDAVVAPIETTSHLDPEAP